MPSAKKKRKSPTEKIYDWTKTQEINKAARHITHIEESKGREVLRGVASCGRNVKAKDGSLRLNIVTHFSFSFSFFLIRQFCLYTFMSFNYLCPCCCCCATAAANRHSCWRGLLVLLYSGVLVIYVFFFLITVFRSLSLFPALIEQDFFFCTSPCRAYPHTFVPLSALSFLFSLSADFYA